MYHILLNSSLTKTQDELNLSLTRTQEELQSELNSCFQSVSNGKKLLASALLTKGINISADASFEELKESIIAVPTTIVVNNMPGTIEYTYHNHIGSSSVKGGCYTKEVYHGHSDGCYCSGLKKYSGWRSGQDSQGYWNYKYVCNRCGAEEYYRSNSPEWDHYNHSGWRCMVLKCSLGSSIVGYSLNCGYAEGQIVEAKIIF